MMNEGMIFIVIGFMLASYSVVANDSIQTLGTFLHSNSHRKWWVLWLFSSTIMVGVMVYGWLNYNGDVSYDRLDKVYSKMVDFKGAQKTLDTAADDSEAPYFPLVKEIEAGIKGSEEIYLAENSQLEQHIATYQPAIDALKEMIDSGELSDEQSEALNNVVLKTNEIVESMLIHRNVENFIKWYYIIPPIVLLFLTRWGFPVSTSFLILITFQPAVLGSMLTKSVMGYLLAFVVAIVVYLTVMRVFERKWRDQGEKGISPGWVVAQWCSTGFLWSMWLIQDMANIFVYVQRPLPLVGLILTITWMVAVQAYIYFSKGGRIQQIVQSKTNTHDIRSATIVDLIYGVVLYYFKIQSNIPMSTTWVFIGLLAGREFAFSLAFKKDSLTLASASKLMGKDLGKVLVGLVVSIGLAYLVRALG
ncbi:MAG: hypothetical protein MI748_01205 [Opitutales bacterium]|nr:hypothetical protein [Opitutales bacterium]